PVPASIRAVRAVAAAPLPRAQGTHPPAGLPPPGRGAPRRLVRPRLPALRGLRADPSSDLARAPASGAARGGGGGRRGLRADPQELRIRPLGGARAAPAGADLPAKRARLSPRGRRCARLCRRGRTTDLPRGGRLSRSEGGRPAPEGTDPLTLGRGQRF